MKIVKLGAALLLLAACNHVPTPSPAKEASADPAPATPCGSACANLARYSCEEFLQDDGGAPCADVCQAGVNGGIPMHVACVSSATSVGAIRACGLPCRSGR